MNNNKNEHHLTAHELVGLPGLPGSVYGIHKKAARENWPRRQRAGRGGSFEYPLSCLPAAAQVALAERMLSPEPAGTHPPGAAGFFSSASAADVRAESLTAMFEAKPAGLKADAQLRLGIVREYHRLLGLGIPREQVEPAITRQFEISAATLGRYLALVRGKPEHLWLYELCPAYTGRTATAAMSAEAWEFLKADYLRLERPAASACIARVKRAAAEHGWTLPSERTMLRRLNALPRGFKVLAREGRKAAMQQLYPAQVRSRAALCALDIVNADGYQHNVWVRFKDGEVCRPKTWCWQDVHSSKALAWRTDKTENTESIRLSLGDLVERYGIPGGPMLDNTMAAANKAMSGGAARRYRFTVREDDGMGVFKALGMNDPIWVTPGWGQAKPVERIFGTGGLGEVVDKHPAFKGAWTGSNTLDKPEYTEGTRAIDIDQFERILADEIRAFNAKTGRRGLMMNGRSFDEVFAESYARIVPRRATEVQRRLWLLASEPVMVRRDGTIHPEAGRISRTEYAPTQANRYWHADLVDHAGRKVIVRFDPAQLHERIYVYSLDNRFLCEAACIEAAGFNDQAKGREHNRARRARIRAIDQQLQQERRMDALQAAKFLPGAAAAATPADATIPGPKVVRAEFRAPIEAPSAASRAAAEFMEQAEAAVAAPAAAPVSVRQLRSEPAKHDYWQALNKRRAAGETLDAADEQFWQSWQSSSYYVEMTWAEQEEAIATQRRANGG